MLHSDYLRLCNVSLPYAGRQMYMHTFDIAAPVMAHGYEDYLAPVTRLLESAGALSGLAHMTVDEKIVSAGWSQRRPGPHVDGCFMPERKSWGHGWLHYCNDIGRGPIARMPVIIAASAPGCRAWRGEFDGEPASDGDLSHLRLGDGEVLAPNVGYLLSPDCVHESMRMGEDTRRTFLRLALPAEFWQAVRGG